MTGGGNPVVVEIVHCTICGYGEHATRLAARIRDDLGWDADVRPGGWGQYDVLADGRKVATKGGNLLTRMLTAMPGEEQIVDQLRLMGNGGRSASGRSPSS